jgi:hypothetical protein
MPKSILIAALGEHPAVVTGLVKALREIQGIEVDTLHVLHPRDTGKEIAQLGYPLVKEHLEDRCQVQPCPLPFADANTQQHSRSFLRTLAKVLSQYDAPERYHVYLSLTSDRKNMAALMALVPQFFPAVRGLYHLLNRHEGRGSGFPSIEQLVLMPHEQQLRALDPPLDYLNLIPVPYPGAFIPSSDVWRFLKSSADQDDPPPIPLPPEAETFFRSVFNPERGEAPLQVWLSQTAYEQYQAWAAAGSHYAAEFLTCFKQMREPRRLKSRTHGAKGEYYFYKRPRTRERPFVCTEPNPIYLYPQKPVERVIVCGLSVEQEDGQYDPTREEWLASIDRQPYQRLSALEERDLVLLVPLGKSPMIATQTYTLLRESEEEGQPDIPTVAVLYPQRSALIHKGVRILRKQFERRGVEFRRYPIAALRDVDSKEGCETYLGTLLSTIDRLRSDYPDRDIALSLSGGRKGMSALTLFAAQQAGIERLYHTLITDIALEERIEDETGLDDLERLPTEADRAARLLLDTYDEERFEIFTIPVIPLQR